ncbi:hypothetical protein AAFC00_004052 [Neodothiora populina]|uniref:SH3 domain-containing protein n=1 Tax=Neodothiora populina TaxID=2781224 RepID=A0ABR3PIE7_9PEZI
MQRVQRKFGTFLKRSEDEADVGGILHEFNETERFLTSFISNGESFREGWNRILRSQLSVAETFHTIYEPIGTEENVKHITAPTPEHTLVRASQSEALYAELGSDLAQEVAFIDSKLLQPAVQAKNDLGALKKVIKKREDRKLDYERYHTRVESARRKETRSPKEDAALMKHESDLELATHEYHEADEHIKQVLPPLVDAVSRLLPYLLATQIMIQHSLIAQLYTAVYGFCQQQGMPVSPPELEDVVAEFSAEFDPLRNEVEGGLGLIANGKAVHQPMEFVDNKQGSLTGLGLRNALAEKRNGSHGSLPRPSMPSFLSRKEEARVEEEEAPTKPTRPGRHSFTNSAVHDEEEAPPEKPPRPGSARHFALPSHAVSPSRMSPGGQYNQRPAASPSGHSDTSSPYLTPQGGSQRVSRPSGGSDYFGGDRKPSPGLSSSMASGIAAKKKPPPPVPAKRIHSSQGLTVTALYDFAGQNPGDLSFQEGDKIRIIKKTESTNDWWQGEIRGVTGAFPANYVAV